MNVPGTARWQAAAGEPVREFGAMTDDLNAMATWLIACGVDTVALESTGEAFVDQGQQRYEEQQLERSVAALKRRVTTLGFAITPVASEA